MYVLLAWCSWPARSASITVASVPEALCTVKLHIIWARELSILLSVSRIARFFSANFTTMDAFLTSPNLIVVAPFIYVWPSGPSQALIGVPTISRFRRKVLVLCRNMAQLQWCLLRDQLYSPLSLDSCESKSTRFSPYSSTTEQSA